MLPLGGLPSACHLFFHATTADVCSVVGILLSPFLGLLDGVLLILLPVVSDGLVERVVAVGSRQKCLDGKQDLLQNDNKKTEGK